MENFPLSKKISGIKRKNFQKNIDKNGKIHYAINMNEPRKK